MKVVIIGAGAIGASIAYFLAKKNVHATVIERCGVACAASGKSGGFLALDCMYLNVEGQPLHLKLV